MGNVLTECFLWILCKQASSNKQQQATSNKRQQTNYGRQQATLHRSILIIMMQQPAAGCKSME